MFLHKSEKKFRSQFFEFSNHSLCGSELLRIVPGRDDSDRRHACSMCRFDSGGGVFHHDTFFGRTSESFGGEKKAVRFRFSVLDVASADDRTQ